MTLSLPATSSTATYPMGTLKCFESMNFTTLSDSMIQPESGGVVGEEARHHLWSLQGDEDPLRSHDLGIGRTSSLIATASNKGSHLGSIVEYNDDILGFGNETPSVNIIIEPDVQGLQWAVP
ncbi:hypothetical protein V6N11_052391 [Hibiscus sabdariffa]|uniref:Uncharacterized protein n=1 Tax=Hibiscus sabdariffa TaxID=183260 RepID=A0ABR2UAM9_9ROSI